MLQIGTKIRLMDNSGARAVRIYNLGKKKTYKNTYISINNYAKGSVVNVVPHKKIKKKNKVMILITATKKKCSRKNGSYFNFFSNLGLIIVDNKKRKPVATKSKLTVPKEIKRDKKNKLLYKVVSKAF